MPTYPANALVLHRHPLGEKDRTVVLYTPEQGKISAVAKGAQRATSRFIGATEPFTQLRLLLATGRNLDIITQCEIVNAYPSIRQNLERLSRALYICDLLNTLTHPRDYTAAPEIFELTTATLTLLEHGTLWPDAPIHTYEMQLLDTIGYAPALDLCAQCEEPLLEPPFGFSPSAGGALCKRCRHIPDAFTLPADALAILRMLQTNPPKALGELNPPKSLATTIERALYQFIRFRAERPLRSAEFLAILRSQHKEGLT